MFRFNTSSLFYCWVVILIIELLSFYGLTNRVHDQEEVLFYLTLIVITLVVGSVGLIISCITINNNSKYPR
jgi:hypothetical protein